MFTRLCLAFYRQIRRILCGYWEAGQIAGGGRARRHTRTGEVQLLLWEVGPRGVMQECWVSTGSDRAVHFVRPTHRFIDPIY